MMKALTIAVVSTEAGCAHWGVYTGTVRTKPGGGSVMSELELLTEVPLLKLPGGLGANMVNPAVKTALEAYLKAWSTKLGLPCY